MKNASEDNLRVSEEKFSKAFRISPDAISIVRLSNGEYIEINEGFSQLTGYSPEDVIGKNGLILTYGPISTKTRLLPEQMREQGEINNMEAVFKKKMAHSGSASFLPAPSKSKMNLYHLYHPRYYRPQTR
jgi:PAS domain S-box-containing protein